MITSKRFLLLSLAFTAAVTFGSGDSHGAVVASPIEVNSSGSVLAALREPNEPGSSRAGALTLLSNEELKRPVTEIYERISQMESNVAARTETLTSNASFIATPNFAGRPNLNAAAAEDFTSEDITPVPETATWFVAVLGMLAVPVFHLGGFSLLRRRH